MSAPCRFCGVATTGPTTARDGGIGGIPTPHRDYEVGTCAECLTLDPGRAGDAVRAALRIIGKDEADSGLAAEAFTEAGLDVTRLRYDAKFRPAPQRKAWGHVTSEHKAALRAAYVRVLDLRVHAAADHDRPVPPTAPPSGPPGCLACGVGKSTQWYSVRTGAFTRGPDLVDGHVCATCAVAYESVGALGPTFLEKAVLAAKGLDWSEAVRVPGLKAWIATGRKPGKPWSWVEVREAPPKLDPVTALQIQVADLTAEVARLQGKTA